MLITCTECGKEFSDKAPACPNCGCPTSEIMQQKTDDTTENTTYEIDEETANIAIEKGLINTKDDLVITAGKYSDSGFFSTFTYIIYVTNDRLYLCRFDKAEKDPKPDVIIQRNYDADLTKQLTFDYNLCKFSGSFGDFDAYKVKGSNQSLKDAYYEILNRSDPHKAELFYSAMYLNRPYCPKCYSLNIDYNFVTDSANTKGKSEVRKKSIVTRTGNSLGRKGMILATCGLWALTPKKSKYKETKKSKTNIASKKIAVCQDCGYSWEAK